MSDNSKIEWTDSTWNPVAKQQELTALEMIDRGATFFVSHSGGKDSQAMYLRLLDIVPHDQLVVVHADLGEVEWDGVQDHVKSTVSHRLHVVRAGKTFFEMVRSRAKNRPEVPSWPSPSTRQCTSDLKRGPIYKFIRNHMAATGSSLAVNCTGIRAEESSARSKQPEWTRNNALSVAGRIVYEWKPIHKWTTAEVFAHIEAHGQKPFWAYAAGNKRLSCVFCIMGCDNDLRHGAKQRPELYEKYLAIEEETGWSMFHKHSLRDRVERIVDDNKQPTLFDMMEARG